MTRYRFRAILAAGTAAVAVAAVGAAAAALPASPAAAGPVSCPGGGSTCDIGLYQQVTLGGDHGTSGSAAPIPLPPAPCWYRKLESAVTMAQDEFTTTQYGYGTNPNPNTPLNKEILQHANATYSPAKGLRFNGPPQGGSWYILDGTPGNAASIACLNSASLTAHFQFVTPGRPAPMPPVNIPPVDLADYAANHQTIPGPDVTLSQGNTGYTNSGIFVWGHWAASPTTGRMTAYKTTATLGNETVTVWSIPQQLVVNAIGPAQTASPCGPTGSATPVGHAPYLRPGKAPDCGLVPTVGTNGLGIGATVTWTRTWGVGNLNGPGGNALPSATITGPAKTIRVDDINVLDRPGVTR